MAATNYIATADGYIDGRIIKEGEAFTADFRELVREGKAGADKITPIKRGKDGNAVRGKVKVPTWAEPANAAEFAAAQAADGDFAEPNLAEMDDSALQAYAATLKVAFDKKTSREDLIAAIGAHKDYARG